jgi:phosphate transport system substrate-binding protein
MKKIFLLLLLAGCSARTVEVGIIRITGSDTMLQLNEMLAEKYMTYNKGVSVYVRGGGSLVGFKALINNEADICASSKKIDAAEIKNIADRFGSLGMSHLIAKDAFSILVNRENEVTDLSLGQLKNIFIGKITNWAEVGGKDEEILPVIRTKNSGSYEFFKKNVLDGEEYTGNCLRVPTTNAVLQAIQDNPNSVGYGGIGYVGDVKTLKIDGIAPNESNVIRNKYELTRYLHYYTTDVPTGPVKDFIDWVTGPDGQKTVKQAGYYPLWEIPY